MAEYEPLAGRTPVSQGSLPESPYEPSRSATQIDAEVSSVTTTNQSPHRIRPAYEIPSQTAKGQEWQTSLSTAVDTTAQLRFVRDERDDLRARLEMHLAASRAIKGDALRSDAALFLLDRIIESGVIGLPELTEILRPPSGWIALARLWRAGLVHIVGNEVLPTAEGERVARDIAALRNRA